MQGFFSEHWEIVAVIFNLLIGAIVALSVALARVQLKYIDRHQHRQDRRLTDLECDVGVLKNDGVRTSEQIGNLSQLLEHYFQEMKEDMRQYREENLEGHKDIKSLLKARSGGVEDGAI